MRVNIGHELDSTLFGLAIDQRNPKNMFCASSGGQVFASDDGGEFWTDHHLPEGRQPALRIGLRLVRGRETTT